MNEKIKKSNYYIGERGAITLFVLLAVLFFIIIIVGLYIQVSNKETAQSKEVQMIQNNYEEPKEIDDIYEETKKELYENAKLEVALIASSDTTKWTNKEVILRG